MLRFALGTLASFGVFFFVYVLEGGGMYWFILPSILLIVLLVPLFAALAIWSPRELAGAWKAAFGQGLAEAEGRAAAALWDFYEKTNYTAGLVGSLAGYIIILQSPGGGSGNVYGLGLVCFVEGILLGLVARILRARVEKNSRPR